MKREVAFIAGVNEKYQNFFKAASRFMGEWGGGQSQIHMFLILLAILGDEHGIIVLEGGIPLHEPKAKMNHVIDD